MSERWQIEIDEHKVLIRSPHSSDRHSGWRFYGSGSSGERAAYSAIRQLLADLRERAEERDRTHREFQAAWDSAVKANADLRERDERIIAMREALDEIAGLSRALWYSGPDECDPQGVSDALESAVDIAHNALNALAAKARKWESAFDAVHDALQSEVEAKSTGYEPTEELHETAARVLKERDELAARLRSVAQTLIEETGADGPWDAETAASAAVSMIRGMSARLREIEAQEPVWWCCDDDRLDVEFWRTREEAESYVESPIPLYAAPVAPRVVLPDVDALSSIIRAVDGNHSLGAGALAEAIIAEIKRERGQ